MTSKLEFLPPFPCLYNLCADFPPIWSIFDLLHPFWSYVLYGREPWSDINYATSAFRRQKKKAPTRNWRRNRFKALHSTSPIYQAWFGWNSPCVWTYSNSQFWFTKEKVSLGSTEPPIYYSCTYLSNFSLSMPLLRFLLSGQLCLLLLALRTTVQKLCYAILFSPEGMKAMVARWL